MDFTLFILMVSECECGQTGHLNSCCLETDGTRSVVFLPHWRHWRCFIGIPHSRRIESGSAVQRWSPPHFASTMTAEGTQPKLRYFLETVAIWRSWNVGNPLDRDIFSKAMSWLPESFLHVCIDLGVMALSFCKINQHTLWNNTNQHFLPAIAVYSSVQDKEK